MGNTGSAIRTYSGALFDFASPETSPIILTDIAHSLSLLCRFAGHVNKFYSVAEHAVRVSYVCPEEHMLWGLHHDDSECYTVDVPRPLKHLLNMSAYRAHEKRVQKAICKHLGLSLTEPPKVKEADATLLATEQRDLLNGSLPNVDYNPYEENVRKVLNKKVKPWTSKKAEKMFLLRHKELSGEPLSFWEHLRLFILEWEIL